MIRIGVPLVGAVCLVYAVVAAARMRPADVTASPPAEPPVAAFEHAVAATGQVEPSSETVALGPPEPGLVTHVYVAPNATLTRGQKLFSLDDRDLRAELARKQADLAAAEARLNRLRALPRPEEVPASAARLLEAEAEAAEQEDALARARRLGVGSAVSREELARQELRQQAARARLARARADHALLLAGVWEQDLAVARREVDVARAAVRRVEADLGRRTVCAPDDGVLLKLNVRPGEYAPTGRPEEPLLLVGRTDPLHVRAEVDEEDAWRVRPGARAEAHPRGRAGLRTELAFVRFEPHVVPKQSLRGAGAERVDTRVLQVIYRVEGAKVALFVGQQVDVFIEAPSDGF